MTAHNAKRGFTRRMMQHEVFSDWQYAGMITRKDAVAACEQWGATGYLPSSSGPAAVGNACKVLKQWDLHTNLDSRGAIFYRRFWDNLMASPEGTAYAYAHNAPFWKTQFDASNPVTTPAGLNTADPTVANALGDAINDLRTAKLPLDVAVGKVQGVEKNGRWYPIHGGPGDPNGDFNAIWTTWTAKGPAQVDGGSSFVQVVTWNDGPCPNARTILTYSESTDPTSPHYADQTALFSKKQWVRDEFCDFRESPVKHVLHLTS